MKEIQIENFMLSMSTRIIDLSVLEPELTHWPDQNISQFNSNQEKLWILTAGNRTLLFQCPEPLGTNRLSHVSHVAN